MGVDRGDLDKINSERLEEVKEGLEGLLVSLRSRENRDEVEEGTIHRIGQVYLQAESDGELRVLCARTVANAVADCERNRAVLLEDQEFLAEVGKKLLSGDDVKGVNVALTLLFNFSNDYEPGTKLLADNVQLPGYISKAISVYHKNDEFLLPVALNLVELYLEQGAAQGFPEAIIDILLEISSDVVGAAPDDEDDWQPVLILMRLIESDEKFEKEFSSNRKKFFTLLEVGRRSIGLDNVGQHALAVVGNISSREEFSEMIRISADDDIYVYIQNIIQRDTNSLMLLSAACCILGNLAIDADRVTTMMNLKPDLVEIVMRAYEGCTNAFQLQGTHLLKNISATPQYKGLILDNGAVDLVRRLSGVKLFFSIRRLGIQMARNLLRDMPNPNQDLLDVVVQTFKTDDNDMVKLDCLQAEVAAIESMAASKCLDECQHLPTIVPSLVKGMSGILSASPDNWNGVTLLKTSKALGILSAQPQGQELLLKNPAEITDLLHFSDKIKSQVKSPQDTLLGVVKNLGFIASKLSHDPNLHDTAQTAIRNATN